MDAYTPAVLITTPLRRFAPLNALSNRRVATEETVGHAEPCRHVSTIMPISDTELDDGARTASASTSDEPTTPYRLTAVETWR